MSTVNISALLANPTAVQQVTFKVAVIQNADGSDRAGFIIVGKNSKEHQDVAAEIRADNMTRGAKRGAPLDTSKEEDAAMVVAAMRENELKELNAVVVGWFGFGEGEGDVEAPFDAAKAKQLINAMPMWQDMISNALNKNANFMKV